MHPRNARPSFAALESPNSLTVIHTGEKGGSLTKDIAAYEVVHTISSRVARQDKRLVQRDASVNVDVVVPDGVAPRDPGSAEATARTDPGGDPERDSGSVQQGEVHLEARKRS